MLKILLAALLCLPAVAQQGSVIVGKWAGLNDTEASAGLPEWESPALSDVESNLDGSAIMKRKGFNREATLTYSSSPVSGIYQFKTDAGDLLKIVCHDSVCQKSTNGAAFATFFATATKTPTYWSFGDVDGDLYAFNDKRDKPIVYDGTNLTYSTTIPRGSVAVFTEDRLVVSDVSSNPNRLYYSKAGLFSHFTTGINSDDSWTDDLGAPGERTTALHYSKGALYRFTRTTITRGNVGDQYNTIYRIISPNIGTADPQSVASAPDGIYFKGQDGHFWRINDEGLTQVSKKISTLIKSQPTGAVRSNTQTTQTDWEAGVQFPTGTWNTTSLAGSIFASSLTWVDTSSSDFAAGSVPSLLTVQTTVGAVQFSSASHRIYNGDFEQGTCSSGIYWTCSTAGSSGACVFSADGAIDGSCGAQIYVAIPGGSQASVRIKDGSAIVYERFYTTDSTILSGGTIDLASLGLSTRTLSIAFNAFNGGNDATLQSTTFTAISSISWSGQTVAGGVGWGKLDDIKVNRYFSLYQSSATPQFFSSRVFDVGYSTPIGGQYSVTTASEAGTGFNFQIRSSSTGVTGNKFSGWTNISTGAYRIAETGRFEQWGATFTTSVGTATPVFYDASLQFATTGQARTTCIQPGANISGYGILSCDMTTAGNGSVVIYATSAYTCAQLPALTPIEWQNSVTNNATLPITVSSAVYIGFRSLLGSATDQAQVNSCTLYWSEGVVAPPTFGVYDSVRNALFFSVATGNVNANNTVLKYDLNLGYFYPWTIPASALAMVDNNLYFGGSGGGFLNRYGVTDTDNGSSFSASWKSKDFSCGFPFQEKKWGPMFSLVAKNQLSGSMTTTFGTSNGSSESFTVGMSTTSTIPYVRKNYSFRFASPSTFSNVTFSNTSSTPFEIYTFGYPCSADGIRVLGP